MDIIVDSVVNALSDPSSAFESDELDAIQPYLLSALSTMDELVDSGLFDADQTQVITQTMSDYVEVPEIMEQVFEEQIEDPKIKQTAIKVVSAFKKKMVDTKVKADFTPVFQETEVEYFRSFQNLYLKDLINGLDMSKDGNIQAKILEILRQFPHPYPLVIGSSEQGELTIIFTKETFMPYSDKEIEIYVQWLVDKEFMTLEILEDDFVEQVTGTSKFEQSYFSEASPSETQ